MSRNIRMARPEPPARLALRRLVTLFVSLALLTGMIVPVAVFAGTRNWSLTRTPSSVTGGAPASVQVTATNIGDDGGDEAVGCVIIAIPASAFTVTNVVVDSVSDGDIWSASFSGDATWWYAKLVSDSGQGNGLRPLESVAATITFNDTGMDGTFTWTGNAYNKRDCTDDFAMPRTVSVTIDGAVADNPPVAQPDSYGTGRNTPLSVGAPGVLINDTDPDGDAMTATQTGAPTNGTLAWGGDGSFTYTPDAGFVGTDSFTYRATAAGASSADVTVTIAVTNSAPVTTDDTYSVAWSQLLVVPPPGILGNDSDPDGDPLTASIVSGPSNGILLPNANGSFTYQPNLLFVGTDSFVYAASDGLTSTQATVLINVANAAPVASADGPYAATEDAALSVAAPGVLGNDSDPDGDALTAVLVDDAANGTVNLRADGSFDYVPDANTNGADSFTYRASDGLDTSSVTTVSISVAAADDPPVASPDTYVTNEDTTLTIPAPGVLGNDTELDGDAVTAAVVSTPQHGQITLETDGSFTYVPDADFHGSDSLTYAIDDGTSSDTATVTLTVASVNDAPVAAADSRTTEYGTSVLVDVVSNDTDVDGDDLIVSAVSTPSAGSAAIEANRIRYTPATGFSGAATFVYTVSDGAATDTVSVTVTVAPEPTPTPTPTPPARTPVPSPTPSTTAPPSTTAGPSSAPDSTPASSPAESEPPAPSPTPSASPTPTPAPTFFAPPSEGGSGGGDGLQPLAAPEVTTTFGQTDDLFEFAGLFGGFGGGFAWAMPAAILGVPGLLFMLAISGQLLGAAAWIPAIRRTLAGIGVRRRGMTGPSDR